MSHLFPPDQFLHSLHANAPEPLAPAIGARQHASDAGDWNQAALYDNLLQHKPDMHDRYAVFAHEHMMRLGLPLETEAVHLDGVRLATRKGQPIERRVAVYDPNLNPLLLQEISHQISRYAHYGFVERAFRVEVSHRA